ncbi:MAG: hypothetical protein GX628_04795 [Clostridiales bacterium]|nr:hypothetical protein [Clostridiales bacterium]
MKVCIVQPLYSFSADRMQSRFEGMLDLIARCDDTMDVIVLPEYCDVPATADDKEGFHAAVAKYNSIIFETVKKTAIRCGAIVFANFADITPTGLRNTTWAFGRDGEVKGKYCKAHPAPSEVKTAAQGGNELDCSYSYAYEKPYTLELEGVRYGFMTCYDFYMYESFPVLARENVDIIIGCSHQRTDSHNALDLIGRFLCYNTNAYLLRSSVSLGEDSQAGGCSMIVSPKGEMLADMKNRVGLCTLEIDPHDKYFKPAGFRGAPKAHYEYIDDGRRPWLYRPAGSMMVPSDNDMAYPRVCAHRGFKSVLPENTLPAFGAAVALGAEEIEFDLWSTKDGELVSIHDSTIDRVSNGTGLISDHTLEELRALDFGVKRGENYQGLKITTFEEILKKFSCTTIMNIHVKIWEDGGFDPQYERIAGLIRQYGAERHCYMMAGADKGLAEFRKIAPDINICVGWDGDREDMLRMPKRALALGAEKIQLFKPHFNQDTIDLARKHGIKVNIFWANDPAEAVEFIKMGADTILTDDYLKVANAVKAYIDGGAIQRNFLQQSDTNI